MPEKKKVLYVITKGNFGGAQRYVYDLAVSLPKEKFDAVVVCGQGDLLIEKLKEKRIRVRQIEELGREIDLKDDYKVFKNLTKIIKEEKPNIIHLNSSKIGFLGSLATFYLRILSFFPFLTHAPLPTLRPVFTAHNWAFNDVTRSSFSKVIYYIAHYLTVIFCHTVIVVSEKVKRDISWLLGFQFLKNKIKIIHNGVECFKLMAQKEARQLLIGKEQDKIIIFSISELHPNKGIDVALKSIAMLPREKQDKIIYCIAGDGEEKENLKNMAKNMGILGMIKFPGFLPEAKKYLSGADIFLLPSRNEAFPYAILEAGKAGLPIIATSVGGVGEVIKDMQNGILTHKNNPKEIAEAISYLLDHKEKQKEFGEEIKKTVTDFFSLKKMLDETLKIYSDL